MVEKVNGRARALNDAIATYIAETARDLYVFSGSIDTRGADKFVELVAAKKPRAEQAAVFLTTYGGDAHAAYRMAKCLQRAYGGRIRLLVSGSCKSAGTLVAIAAQEIGFGELGELGPLDIQMAKPDELLPLSSGLDIFNALTILTSHAFSEFENYMLSITGNSGGNISAKTAADIATQLVTGLFGPIAAQIDPMRLGENQRAIKIAKEYGERLGLTHLKPKALDTLVESYPSHGFVIDFEEAQKLFKNVDAMTDREDEIASLLKRVTRYPSPQLAIVDLGSLVKPEEEKTDDKNGSADGGAADSPTAQKGESGVGEEETLAAREFVLERILDGGHND